MPDTEDHKSLIEACECLDVATVRAHIKKGADLECLSIEGNTPLLCVIDVVHLNPSTALEIAQLLLAAGANIEARGYMDKTPFLKACTRVNLEMLRLLVKNGCDIHAVCDDFLPVTGQELADIFHASKEFKDYLRGLYHA